MHNFFWTLFFAGHFFIWFLKYPKTYDPVTYVS